MPIMDKDGQEIRPENMNQTELERLGAWLANKDKNDKHICPNRDTCVPYAGSRCGTVGRELHRVREIWRQKNAAHWGKLACRCGQLFEDQAALDAHKAIADSSGESEDHGDRVRKAIPEAPTYNSVPGGRPRAARGTRRTDINTSTRSKSNLFTGIDEGYYALGDGKGGYDFYKVDVPTEGRWKNYRFIREWWPSDNSFHQIRDLRHAMDLLTEIDKDPKSSAALFKRYGSKDMVTSLVRWRS